MADFDWPWQYKFPPFFTIQPNIETRKKQLEAWCSLVLEYQRHTKQYSLDVTEAQSSELFYNKQLNRKLNLDAIYTVLEELRKRGNLTWKDKNRKSCTLIWRTYAEWGKIIYTWVVSRSMTNTVCTLYELTNGEDSEDQEFHGLDKDVLIQALQTLEAERKAELMEFDGGEGVKFF
ncbi:vacuolar protein-sorting-associated protein 25 [Plakobranchus ocellatus]|uniref:Vacuolar protein-sorting-associated protein 25 n=1 Tax=Plakobranchus ocellatus TaxID=259542 RepID=A0AAV4AEU7_9GAST|nr:vacuolar protein-sorting-associated protein 25 [Plakobranchus ocellatus]